MSGDITGIPSASYLLKEPPNTAEHQHISDQSEAIPANRMIMQLTKYIYYSPCSSKVKQTNTFPNSPLKILTLRSSSSLPLIPFDPLCSIPALHFSTSIFRCTIFKLTFTAPYFSERAAQQTPREEMSDLN